jgi:hypothetical protein
MIRKLIAANNDALPEGLEITVNTLKLAFGGYDPVTGVLVHAYEQECSSLDVNEAYVAYIKKK